MNYKIVKKIGALSTAALLIFSMAGCADGGSYVKEELADMAVGGNATSDNAANGSAARGASAGSTVDGASLLGVSVTYLNGTDMFTRRDKEIGYDENTATAIVLADNASSCNEKSASINDNIVTITEEGVYLLSGALSNGQIIVDADDLDKVQLVLDGVDINCNTSAAIYVREADKVFLTLAAGSVNSLRTSKEFSAVDSNNIDGVIFSKSDLTLNGNGSLTIESAYGHGIVSKDDLKITGGAYDVTAASSALSGKDSVRIADGVFFLHAQKDGVHSQNEEEEDKGFIYIAGGNFTMDCGSDGMDASSTLQIDGGQFSLYVEDDGFHADGDVIINDGNIIIDKCHEGLEGQTVTINGGTISLTSADDGINATNKNSQNRLGGNCAIMINGGVLKIIADGDGIDSNGNLAVTGGEVYVSTPTNNGNSALDYDGNALIAGGILVAAGDSQMAQNFGESSTQGSMLVMLSSRASAGDAITLTDSSGKELLAYIPERTYGSVVLSCPQITEGSSYTLTAGSQSLSIEMDSLLYGGSGFGFGGRPHGFEGGQPGFEDGRRDFDGNSPRFDGNVPDGEGNPPNFDNNGQDFNGGRPNSHNGNSRGNRQMPEG